MKIYIDVGVDKFMDFFWFSFTVVCLNIFTYCTYQLALYTGWGHTLVTYLGEFLVYSLGTLDRIVS